MQHGDGRRGAVKKRPLQHGVLLVSMLPPRVEDAALEESLHVATLDVDANGPQEEAEALMGRLDVERGVHYFSGQVNKKSPTET